MKTINLKQQIISAIRKQGLTLSLAAKKLGVPESSAQRWCDTDKDFAREVKTVLLAGDMAFILAADDLERSGRELTEREQDAVKAARQMLLMLPHLYPEEMGWLLDGADPREDFEKAESALEGALARAKVSGLAG
jgi:hypothetical protein